MSTAAEPLAEAYREPSRPTWSCASCRQAHYGSAHDGSVLCVQCYGTPRPGRMPCFRCAAFQRGRRVDRCERLRTPVEGWWTGCMLHTTTPPAAPQS